MYLKIIYQTPVFYSNSISSSQECDAAIVTTSYAYESVSLKNSDSLTCRRKCIFLDLLFSPVTAPKVLITKRFSEKCYLRHGEQSVFLWDSFFSMRSNTHTSYAYESVLGRIEAVVLTCRRKCIFLDLFYPPVTAPKRRTVKKC